MLAFPVRHEVLMAAGFVVADGRDTASSFGSGGSPPPVTAG